MAAVTQNELGRLTEAVESLKEQARHHADELQSIGKDVHAAKVGIRIIIGIFLIAGSTTGFLLNRLADLLQGYITSPKLH